MTRVLASPAEALCLGVVCTVDSPWDDKHKAEIGAGGVLGRWQGLGDTFGGTDWEGGVVGPPCPWVPQHPRFQPTTDREPTETEGRL